MEGPNWCPFAEAQSVIVKWLNTRQAVKGHTMLKATGVHGDHICHGVSTAQLKNKWFSDKSKE